MNLLIGIVIVIVCTLGSYVIEGGKLSVIWQPFEGVIIIGSAVGAYIIANPKKVLRNTFKEINHARKGPIYDKAAYLELLTMLYQVFKLAKTKGLLSLEQHIENPNESSLLQQFPRFMSHHHAVTMLCDYLRLVSLGSDKPYEIEALMEQEIEVHHEEVHMVPHALQTMADGMPALGIVAAVLGVINTMGHISEPPEVLGHMIGSALVGTFLGVWTSYGYIAPIANSVKEVANSEAKYYQCMKVGLIAHLHGYAPSISIEYARKSLNSDMRPTFIELEEATTALPPPG